MIGIIKQVINMEKVVILARVSTDKQEYQRQVNELTDYCQRAGWNVEAIFSNKVSEAKKMEERSEIMELVEFVKSNNIDKVVCLEISSLGRNTLEALKVIQYLNEHNVSLFVKNYGIETLTGGKVNPVASPICTILLEIASVDRLAGAGRSHRYSPEMVAESDRINKNNVCVSGS